MLSCNSPVCADMCQPHGFPGETSDIPMNQHNFTAHNSLVSLVNDVRSQMACNGESLRPSPQLDVNVQNSMYTIPYMGYPYPLTLYPQNQEQYGTVNVSDVDYGQVIAELNELKDKITPKQGAFKCLACILGDEFNEQWLKLALQYQEECERVFGDVAVREFISNYLPMLPEQLRYTRKRLEVLNFIPYDRATKYMAAFTVMCIGYLAKLKFVAMYNTCRDSLEELYPKMSQHPLPYQPPFIGNGPIMDPSSGELFFPPPPGMAFSGPFAHGYCNYMANMYITQNTPPQYYGMMPEYYDPNAIAQPTATLQEYSIEEQCQQRAEHLDSCYEAAIEVQNAPSPDAMVVEGIEPLPEEEIVERRTQKSQAVVPTFTLTTAATIESPKNNEDVSTPRAVENVVAASPNVEVQVNEVDGCSLSDEQIAGALDEFPPLTQTYENNKRSTRPMMNNGSPKTKTPGRKRKTGGRSFHHHRQHHHRHQHQHQHQNRG